MPGLYTEADYENSVIELFRNMGVQLPVWTRHREGFS